MSDTTPNTPQCQILRAASTPIVTAFNTVFKNWPGNIQFTSPLYLTPETLSELANAILQAESAGHHVRAFGSKWSFSDALRATTGSPPQPGAMIVTENLKKSLQFNLHAILAAGMNKTFLFHVEAGIKFTALNLLLHIQGQALESGGGSGQSLAGMMATSTHSADSLVPPMVDYVRAIHLVGAGGIEHWIEPDSGITDPAKLQVSYPCLAAGNIHYNTKLFNAVLVSAGSMGVIYSVILKTVPQYGLHQHRVATTWEALLQADPNLAKVIDGTYLASRNSSPPQIDILDAPIVMNGSFAPNCFSQVVINPYPFYANDATLTGQEQLHIGEHLCFVTNRVTIPIPTNPNNPPGTGTLAAMGNQLGQTARNSLGGGPSGPSNDLRFLNFLNSQNSETDDSKKAAALVDFLAREYPPGTISALIHFVLKEILPVADRFDASYKLSEVVSWGDEIRSICVEAAFTVTDALAFVPQVLALVASWVIPPPNYSSYIGGYLALRFVGKKTDALLGMQRWSPTCCVEFLGLAGTRNVDRFVDALQTLALASGGILHLGLQNNVMTAADVQNAYGPANIEAFRRARSILSQHGTLATFDNTFTERLGLSALNGLVFSGNSSNVIIHEWDPGAFAGTTGGHLVESHPRKTEVISLYNHSNCGVQVTDVRITSSKDALGAPVFKVIPPRQFRVGAHQFGMIEVEYAGTGPGLLTGTVEVDCDDPIEPILRMPLSTSVIPLGNHAQLEIDPTSLDFGTRVVTTTQTKIIDVTNVGSYDAGIQIALTLEQPAGQFQAPSGVHVLSGGGPLTPNQLERCYVSYSPTTRGAAHATLVINMSSRTDAGVGYEYKHRYEIPLAGAATMPTIFLARGPQRWVGGRGGTLVPIRDIQLTELDFGVAAPNGTSAASFWIRNVGDAPLTVREVSSLHNLQDSFLADNSIFPATLPPGGEKEVPCVFYGGSLPGKFRSSELRVLSDDPLQSSGLLNVKGRTAGPHLTEPNELLDLGIVPPNPASATITFRSDGTNPVTLRRVYLRLGTEFSVSGAPLMHAQLAPGTALTLTVTLTATQPGVHQDRLFVSHDGQGGRDSNILLKGTVE